MTLEEAENVALLLNDLTAKDKSLAQSAVYNLNKLYPEFKWRLSTWESISSIVNMEELFEILVDEVEK